MYSDTTPHGNLAAFQAVGSICESIPMGISTQQKKHHSNILSDMVSLPSPLTSQSESESELVS